MKLFNYSKEGPGIDKDQPDKKGLKLLFSVYKNNLWEMCKLNMMYIIASIPMIAVFALMSVPIVSQIIESYTQVNNVARDAVISQYYVGFFLMFIFIFLILFGSGPASCAVAYIYRNYITYEHVWLWQDFTGKIKEYFKKGIIVSIIAVPVISLAVYAIIFYYGVFIQTKAMYSYVLMCLIVLFLLLFAFVHFYVYQLIVTFKVRLSTVYKSAVILAFVSLPQNLLSTALICAVCYIIYTSFQSGFSTVITVFIVVSVLRFLPEFIAEETIRKRINPRAM